MLSQGSQSSELAAMVTNAVEKLQTLGEAMKADKCDAMKSAEVQNVIFAVKELEAERTRLHEILETETIKASVLRYKLQYYPLDIRKEIQVAVASARQSNEAEIKRLKDQLETIHKNINALESKQQDLETENSKLQPARDAMQTGHDEIIALLNQKMADKASKQITLNETRDHLRETYKRIIDLEDSIVQLKEDLVHEREMARQEKENLQQSVVDTQKKVEDQRVTNAFKRKEIEKLQEELVDSESSLDTRKKAIRKFETSRSKLEAQEVQLNRQLQKEIRDNSALTQEGMKIVKEHNELQEKLMSRKDELQNTLNQVLGNLSKLDEEDKEITAEKNSLNRDLENALEVKEKDAEVVRDYERRLLRCKEALNQKNSECARIKRENVELESEIEQLKESHQAAVEVYNKQIDESKTSLNAERKDRQVLQTKRDHVTKESNEFKSDYGKYMASMSKKVTEGKQEHARLTEYGTKLQKDLKQDELDIISKQKQLKKAKQDYTGLQKKLKVELKGLQESIGRLEKDKGNKKEIIEDKTPVFKDLEAQFKERTEEFEKMKKDVVGLKNKKSSLETSVQRAEKDLEKMAGPQTQLREQLRLCRAEAIGQLKRHSESIQHIEKDIFTSGQKLGAVLKENHRLKEAIKKLQADLVIISGQMSANDVTQEALDKQLVDFRDLLKEGWTEDLKLDKEFAERDIKLLTNIERLQKETQIREEKIDVIHQQLEEQLGVLANFMDGIASLRPKDTAQSNKRYGKAKEQIDDGMASPPLQRKTQTLPENPASTAEDSENPEPSSQPSKTS
ncbi:coiled-coil domain-containing protein 175 isoform X2 [Nematostella vectensis]|uniref:coiled-coil domain-containing protein 175 isoform X2 n=1 Tax=Nematostella vectensis TaxID=45351 RepID=UPI00139029F3|nr:coiled-coil domain-containing protein 175 isoform X2 [Nematostella vectensis]